MDGKEMGKGCFAGSGWAVQQQMGFRCGYEVFDEIWGFKVFKVFWSVFFDPEHGGLKMILLRAH